MRAWRSTLAPLMSAGLLALVALGVSAGPGVAVAARPAGNHEETHGIPAPIVPRRAQAGDTVVIRWEGLPTRVEECEVMLSLDGGRTFPIRVSPELEGPSAWFVWRVPNWPCLEARVQLRASIDAHEREGPPSESFEIVGDATLPAEEPYVEAHPEQDPHGSRGPLRTETSSSPPSWSAGIPDIALGAPTLEFFRDKPIGSVIRRVPTDLSKVSASGAPSASRPLRIALRI